eukprot:782450-Pelagomonas_calceolata.AAC.2
MKGLKEERHILYSILLSSGFHNSRQYTSPNPPEHLRCCEWSAGGLRSPRNGPPPGPGHSRGIHKSMLMKFVSIGATCPLHSRAPKSGYPDKKVCLACMPNLRAGGALGGPCWPSAQLPDTAISELFAHGLPHFTDTAGLPETFCLAYMPGRVYNGGLWMDLADVFEETIPTPPDAFPDRAAYISQHAPYAHKFRQSSQPWFAARQAACTASSIASVLGLVPKSCPPSKAAQFAMNWGSRHEFNGIASVMNSLLVLVEQVSWFMLMQHALATSIEMPANLAVHEQGLFFLSSSLPIVQGTVFSKADTPFAIAASPDARLVSCNGVHILVEVKCAFPFVERDDGSWMWCSSKKAVYGEGISVAHFMQCQVQMLATGVQYCLLVGWGVKETSVKYIPFHPQWCRQMLLVLSQQLVSGCGFSFHHAEQVERVQFEQVTKERGAAINKSCLIKSVKGPNITRWLRFWIGFQSGLDVIRILAVEMRM